MPESSFAQVYEENYSYIYNYVYMMLLHRENTEDVVGEAFVKAMNGYGAFDETRASVRTWLCAIARNTALDHLKSAKRRESQTLEDAPEPYIEDEYALLQQDANRQAFTALSALKPEEREFLTLRYKLELSNEEIAQLTGSNAKAVSEKYRRLLLKCRGVLEKAGIHAEDVI